MKQEAKIVKCQGEAHSNPYIDNCSRCMPYWGEYPVCPVHDKKLSEKVDKFNWIKETKYDNHTFLPEELEGWE